MKDRIRKLRKTLDMTQAKFGERIGVKGNTVAQYEIGRNEPIPSVINLICNEFGVNEEWLRTGNGEMFVPEPSDALDALAREYNLSTSTYVMLEKFIKLSPDLQEGIFNYICEVAAAFQSGDISSNSPTAPQSTSVTNKELGTVLYLNAAHEIPNSSEEDKQHDEDIMDDEDF